MDLRPHLKRDEICSLINETEVFRSIIFLNTSHPDVRSDINLILGLRNRLYTAFDTEITSKADLRMLFSIGGKVTFPNQTTIKVTVQNLEQVPVWERLREDKYVHEYKNVISLNHPDYTKPVKYPIYDKNTILRFELTAFPSAKEDTPDMAMAMKISIDDKTAIIGAENQMNWLRRYSHLDGFRVVRCSISNFIHKRIAKDINGNPGSIMQVVFRGALMVTDPKLFDCAVKLGVGPAKRYGCGLLLFHADE